MYFTLIFKNDTNEGTTASYDLCFHPCAVWYSNGQQLLIPNPKAPSYEKGYLSDLIPKESLRDFIKKDFSIFNKILVVCHEQGHGNDNDLKNLQVDIIEQGFTYQVLK